MYLGAYNACLADKPLGEALEIIADLGLTSAEINSGGFLPPIHLPVERPALQRGRPPGVPRRVLVARADAHRAQLQRQPAAPGRGLPARAGPRRLDRARGAARRQAGHHDVGHPGGDPGATNPAWNPLPWWSPFLDVRDHQWGVAVPFWKDIQARAADADVKVAIEMHPGNIVFNPSTMHRLAEEINATHVGAEMDPSHLFWQGIDPVLAVADLGELVYIAAAKDTRINEAAKVNGVLDDRFTRVAEGEPGYLPLGGGTTLSGWPTNPSWDFVAVGRGHDTAYWTEFLRALAKIDPDMPVNIEHEDQELDQMEGLRFAAQTLIDAEKAL